MKVLYRRKMRGVSYPITTILTIVILLAVGAALGLYFWKFKGPRAVIEPTGTPTYITASKILKIPLKNNGDADVTVNAVSIGSHSGTISDGTIPAGQGKVIEVDFSSSDPGLQAGDYFDVVIEFSNGAVLTLKGYAV